MRLASSSPRPAFVLLAVLLASCAGEVDRSQAEPPAADGWDFAYPARGAVGASPIDLRGLNEKVAGQSGFVRLSADGNSFVLGDGTPARFWAIGSDVYKGHPPEDVSRHVRFLARIGVNMVRLHAQIAPTGANSKLADANEEEIDGIWRFVAEAREQGIYVTISPYWASAKDANKWGIPGYEGRTELWGVLFLDETLQAGYKAWARALYDRPNKYTGVPLSKDPAVAIIQVQNEDSLLFWTIQGLKSPLKERFAARFAGWLKAKYGSIDAARKAWGDDKRDGDDLANGKVGLVDIYTMTLNKAHGATPRVADQVAFFAETQRDFYAMMRAFYRDELGCGQLVNASNWRTASQTLLDDSERWTYAEATDVVATNRYYNGGVHVGANAGWRIDPGDKFTQVSATLNPRELPVNLKQVVGRPMIVTESSWVSPLAFQSEGPFLVAAYESLTGVDGFYWFSADAVDYSVAIFPYQKVNGQDPLLKFSCSNPSILGGFPASALMFRKGYVKQGEPVVHEERPLRDLWERKTPLIAEDPSFDPNRDQAPPAPARPGAKATAVDPLAFLVGPVEVKYGGDPSKTRVVDLSKYIDPSRKRIRSITGEITLDYGVGLCTVDAPKAQGACGALGRSELIQLKDLAIRSSNDYATVLAVPLDDKTLAESKSVLVQIGTAARPTGWATREAEFQAEGNRKVRGYEVVKTGKAPWKITDAELGLSLRNPNITKATRLDAAGRRAGGIAIKKTAAGVSFTPPSDAMYLLLE